MSYEITETLEDTTTDDERILVQMVILSRPHTVVDFENQEYVKVDKFRFESGWIQLDSDTRIELTRVLQSCSSGHDHGVYYQAPRHMELWEAMFAIGETNGVLPEDVDNDITTEDK
jgi:hypothetical protein